MKVHPEIQRSIRSPVGRLALLAGLAAVLSCGDAVNSTEPNNGRRSGTSGAIRPPGSPSSLLTTISLNPDGTPDPVDLAQLLVGEGVAIESAFFKGAFNAAGAFTGGSGIIGFESGVILSSGSIHDVPGPNISPGTTTGWDLPGDSDLANLSSRVTADAAVLEFTFIPNTSPVFIQFVFGSEEYNEFVGQEYNDVFGFFVNGVNCALTPNSAPISVNSINLQENPQLYRNNELPNATIDTEMDGLTVVLTCQAPVNVGTINVMKLAIADAVDDAYDSNVFIKGGSLSTIPPNLPPVAVAGADILRECTGVNTNVALNGSASSDPDGSIVSYRWLRNGVQIATGVNATVPLALGVHTIVLEVRDDGELTDTDIVVVTVQDTTAPLLTLSPTPLQLLFPDHTYRAVTIGAAATETCGGTVTYGGSIVSNEPDDAPSRDGITTGDIRVTRPGSIIVLSSAAVPTVLFNPLLDAVELRAERRGAAADRLYTITATATDARGNQRAEQKIVTVPR